jgi:tyrosinase
MYLYWFERIVRKHSGMYDWAIPFWDWANPAERQLPPAFRTGGGALFDASRTAAFERWHRLGVDWSRNLGGQCQPACSTSIPPQGGFNGPHGGIHGAVSGNMCCTWTAAQDPIFWLQSLHRRPAVEPVAGAGRRPEQSTRGRVTGATTEFTFFDECCQEVKMRGCDVLRAAKQLSYVYEGEPPQVEQYCPRIWNPGLRELVRHRQNFPSLQAVEEGDHAFHSRRRPRNERALPSSRLHRSRAYTRPDCRAADQGRRGR